MDPKNVRRGGLLESGILVEVKEYYRFRSELRFPAFNDFTFFNLDFFSIF